MEAVTERTSNRRWSAVPLVAVAVFVLGANLWSMIYRVSWPSPLTPWESAYVIAGETVARGGDVYNYPGDPKSGIGVEGPAAVMYGPALPFVLGPLSKLFGPWPYFARVLSLLASAALIGLAVWMQPRKSAIGILVTVTAVMAIHWRSRLFFTDARPDMLAWLFASLALIAYFVAHQSRRWWWYFAGTVLLLLGFLFKQTVAIYACVPFVVLLISSGKKPMREWLMTLVPAAAIALTVAGMMIFAWTVFHYTIRMPSYWPIRWPRVWDAMANAITYDPLFVFCIAIWLVRPEMPRPRLMVWLLAAAGLGIVGGALFFAKTGGSFNSYIPAWLPGAIFSAATLTWLITECQLSIPMRRMAIGVIAPVAMLTSAIGLPRGYEFMVRSVHGHRNYAQAIQIAKQLSGVVVSPEDPTIPLAAKGTLNRTYTVEVESIQYRYIPNIMQQEMHSADWLIWVGSPFTELLEKVDLERLGYVPVFDSGFDPDTYILWKRDRSLEPLKLRQGVTKSRGPGRPITTQPTTLPADGSSPF